MSSSLVVLMGELADVSVFRKATPPDRIDQNRNNTSEREYGPVTSLLLALQGASVAVLAKLGVHGHGRCVRRSPFARVARHPKQGASFR